MTTEVPERYAPLADLDNYKRDYANTTDTHPCEVTGCRLTQEEHHRLAYGFMAENDVLRRRVRDLEEGRRTDVT